jgi:exonuclease SbcD
MFLFKKRKDAPQEKTALDKTESTIKAAKENSKDKAKQKVGSDLPVNKQPGKNEKSNVTVNSTASDKNSPLKVVIPASSLLDDEVVIPAKVINSSRSSIPEEDVDKLLVKVNQDKAVTDIPDISLDILAPPEEIKEKPQQIKTKPEIEPEVKTEVKAEVKPEIKVEAKPPKATSSPSPEKDKKGKAGDGKENLFSNLFGKVEVEEDNPLKRLINSLPDITIDEVINEAEEVKGLMNEWYSSQGKHVIKVVLN